MIFFAHRGASCYAPENTKPAFDVARRMGARALELDVHLCADGTVAVHHDYNLERTAGKEIAIAETAFAELQKHNVAAHFKGWPDQEHILSLPQALQIIGPDMLLNVELKNDSGLYPSLESAVLHCCCNRLKNTIFSSFDHASLKRLRALDSKARIGVLVDGTDFKSAFEAAEAVRAESLHLALRKLDTSVSLQAHEAGLKVYVYTVDTVDAASLAQALGADGVFTNRPDLEAEMLSYSKKGRGKDRR